MTFARIVHKWDVDGTLCEEVCYTPEQCLNATPIPENIERLRRNYDDGFLIIETARKDYLMTATFQWLKRHAIPFHAVSNWKIPGDFYYDVDAIDPRNIQL